MSKTGLSRSSVYELISKGLFPEQVPLVSGGRGVGWVESEVEEYIQRRIEARKN
jgi:prophage regulatory protein